MLELGQLCCPFSIKELLNYQLIIKPTEFGHEHFGLLNSWCMRAGSPEVVEKGSKCSLEVKNLSIFSANII